MEFKAENFIKTLKTILLRGEESELDVSEETLLTSLRAHGYIGNFIGQGDEFLFIVTKGLSLTNHVVEENLLSLKTDEHKV